MTSRTPAPWCAELDLQFARRDGRTVLASQRHTGPLLVQKALYPQGPEICHAAVLHPPGGIAAGDNLSVGATLADGARVVMTTPGATKWYRSEGRPTGATAAQTLRFALRGASTLEWFPRENILYDASRVSMELDVDLSADAKFIGWEILCFGRRASGETWTRGCLNLRTRIVRNGRPRWCESASVDARGGFAHSPVGLAGFTVCGTLLLAGMDADATLLKSCRRIDAEESGSRTGITCVPDMLVARYLGHSSEHAFQWFTRLWTALRPALVGRDAQMLRLWAT